MTTPSSRISARIRCTARSLMPTMSAISLTRTSGWRATQTRTFPWFDSSSQFESRAGEDIAVVRARWASHRSSDIRLVRELGYPIFHDLAVFLLGYELEPAVAGLGDGDDDLLLGQANAAELDREPFEAARVAAAGLDGRTGNLRHAPEAVEDVR